MFFSFVDELRAAGIQASLKEHLTLLEALDAAVIAPRPEDFYYLARATFVKDESLLDRFDQVFGKVFKGLEAKLRNRSRADPGRMAAQGGRALSHPRADGGDQSLGSWDEIMEALKKRLEEQQGRHQGGSKVDRHRGHFALRPWWLQSGRHPDRRRGPARARDQGWDKREFKNLDSSRNSAPATSRSLCAACAASPGRALSRSWISTARSTALRGRAGLTFACARSATMP
jgi:uncharacterized protein with von Willebrand factor type A (vWA) domain